MVFLVLVFSSVWFWRHRLSGPLDGLLCGDLWVLCWSGWASGKSEAHSWKFLVTPPESTVPPHPNACEPSRPLGNTQGNPCVGCPPSPVCGMESDFVHVPTLLSALTTPKNSHIGTHVSPVGENQCMCAPGCSGELLHWSPASLWGLESGILCTFPQGIPDSVPVRSHPQLRVRPNTCAPHFLWGAASVTSSSDSHTASL